MWARAMFGACVVAALVAPARAESSFQVNPTLIALSKAAPAEAVVITNHGTEALRVQASVMTWTEDRNGLMALGATTDVVVRPSLLEIEPGRSKTVRVGTTLGEPLVEGSYRLFVEQLPDRRTVEGGKIVVLTRIGVPVFMTPAKPSEALAATTTIKGNQATVEVQGRGTQRTKLAAVIVRAMKGESVRWERRATGWYVLPGRTRDFTIDLGSEQCRAGEMLVAELVSDSGTTWASSPRRCE